MIYEGRLGTTREMLWNKNSRNAHPLHRICAFQASYPPQLAAYFLDKYGGDARVILDPFAGRGTTLLEAVLRGKEAIGVDLLPTSRALSAVKVRCPPRSEVMAEIDALDLSRYGGECPESISPFFHPKTRLEVMALKYADRSPALTSLALGRLHGHSPGFFSRKTFNVISVTPESMRRMSKKHGTRHEYRDVKTILKKAAERFIPKEGLVGVGGVLGADSRRIPLPSECVDFVVTSPPFLDVVDYSGVNWLRDWFLGHEETLLPLPTVTGDRETYGRFLKDTLIELGRICRAGSRAVVEVGPVKRDSKLEDSVIAAASASGRWWVETIEVNDFEGEKVSKVSRAMRGGKETTTMSNRCVVLKRFE